MLIYKKKENDGFPVENMERIFLCKGLNYVGLEKKENDGFLIESMERIFLCQGIELCGT